jgi:hypothetical protein
MSQSVPTIQEKATLEIARMASSAYETPRKDPLQHSTCVCTHMHRFLVLCIHSHVYFHMHTHAYTHIIDMYKDKGHTHSLRHVCVCVYVCVLFDVTAGLTGFPEDAVLNSHSNSRTLTDPAFLKAVRSVGL